MSWVVFSALAGFFWASVNHIDKHLIEKYFKGGGVGALVVFSSLIGLPVVVVTAVLWPHVFSVDLKSILILISTGVIYLCGVVPYLIALERDDASVVAPLMILSPLFTAILGIWLLGENLTLRLVIAGILILVGAIMLTTEPKEKSVFKIRADVLVLMSTSSLSFSLNLVLFKFAAIDEPFVVSIFWEHIGFLVFALGVLVFVQSYRNKFLEVIKTNSAGILVLNALNETLTIIGNVSFHYASLITFAAVAEVVAEGTQPFFVLLLAIILPVLVPSMKHEQVDSKKLLQRGAAIFVMVAGLLFLNY